MEVHEEDVRPMECAGSVTSGSDRAVSIHIISLEDNHEQEKGKPYRPKTDPSRNTITLRSGVDRRASPGQQVGR